MTSNAETGSVPRPNLADGRLRWVLRETTRYVSWNWLTTSSRNWTPGTITPGANSNGLQH